MDWHWFLKTYAEAAKTAIGFFWKAGWAFVLGDVFKRLLITPRHKNSET